MNFRQKLIADIRTYFKESKWEEMINEHLVQILQMKPTHPYEYVQKKISLKSKFDNTKHSAFLTQILIYCHFVNILRISKTQVQNKILYLCVDKYHHTKIKRNQALNLIQALLMMAEVTDKKKQYFLKLIHQQLQAQIINVSCLAKFLYVTILYIAIKQEVDELDEKLKENDLHLSAQILQNYMKTVNTNVSIIKKSKIELQATGDLYKIIAMSVLQNCDD